MEIFVLIGILAVFGGLYHEAKKAMPHGFLNWLFQERPYWHFWHPGSGALGGGIAAAILAACIILLLSYYWWSL